jgi:hypothetical protein
MESNACTSAWAWLMVLGMALLGACARPAPSTAAPVGELALELLTAPESAEQASSVELEVRNVSGTQPVRRQIVLDTAHVQETHLSLPAGVYSIGLSAATLQADLAGPPSIETQQNRAQLPPPRIVLISAAGTTRARVLLPAADASTLASL